MIAQKTVLRREGFSPATIRKVTANGNDPFYEILSYSHPHYIHERWTRIAGISDEQIESQIREYGEVAFSEAM